MRDIDTRFAALVALGSMAPLDTKRIIHSVDNIINLWGISAENPISLRLFCPLVYYMERLRCAPVVMSPYSLM